MLVLCLMLLGTYYAQNYASLIGCSWCLVSCNNVCDFHNLSHDLVSPECKPKCFGAEENGYIWEPDDKSLGILVQGRLKRHLDYWEQELKAPDLIVESIQEGYVLPLFSPPSTSLL